MGWSLQRKARNKLIIRRRKNISLEVGPYMHVEDDQSRTRDPSVCRNACVTRLPKMQLFCRTCPSVALPAGFSNQIQFLVFTHVTSVFTTVAIRHVGAQTNVPNREVTVRKKA